MGNGLLKEIKPKLSGSGGRDHHNGRFFPSSLSDNSILDERKQQSSSRNNSNNNTCRSPTCGSHRNLLGSSIESFTEDGESPGHDPYLHTDKSFHEVYSMGKMLGSGAFSVVHTCYHKKRGTGYAVKIIDMRALVPEDKRALDNEISIMKEFQHPHIVQLIEVFKEGHMSYLVMELVKGGELFKKIVAKKFYPEFAARDLLRQLVMTVDYLHTNNVIHRDLKPENLLLVSATDDTHVKIADFGFAEHISVMDGVNSACGTPQYVAPEILQGRQCTAISDIWSVGIISFVILGGYPPFYDREKNLLFSKVIAGEFQFHSPFWDDVSDDAKDFICCMLTVDPAKRYTASQLLQHKWFKDNPPDKSNARVNKEFRIYAVRRRFRAAVFAVIAAKRLTNNRNLKQLSEADRIRYGLSDSSVNSQQIRVPQKPAVTRPYPLNREAGSVCRPAQFMRFTSNIQLFRGGVGNFSSSTNKTSSGSTELEEGG